MPDKKTDVRLERDISDKIKKWLRIGRRIGLKCRGTKIHGSNMQSAGMTDWVILVDGRTIYVEVKTTTGTCSKKQNYTHEEIESCGGSVVVLYGWENAKDWLRCVSGYDALQPSIKENFESEWRGK